MGRPVGTREIDVKQILTVVDLTLNSTISRSSIADEADMSKRAVWRYQKRFDLV